MFSGWEPNHAHQPSFGPTAAPASNQQQEIRQEAEPRLRARRNARNQQAVFEQPENVDGGGDKYADLVNGFFSLLSGVSSIWRWYVVDYWRFPVDSQRRPAHRMRFMPRASEKAQRRAVCGCILGVLLFWAVVVGAFLQVADGWPFELSVTITVSAVWNNMALNALLFAVAIAAEGAVGICRTTFELQAVANGCRLFSACHAVGYLPFDRTGDWLYTYLIGYSFCQCCSLSLVLHCYEVYRGQFCRPTTQRRGNMIPGRRTSSTRSGGNRNSVPKPVAVSFDMKMPASSDHVPGQAVSENHSRSGTPILDLQLLPAEQSAPVETTPSDKYLRFRLICYALLTACVFTLDFNRMYVLDVAWTTSQYLEAVSWLPQIWQMGGSVRSVLTQGWVAVDLELVHWLLQLLVPRRCCRPRAPRRRAARSLQAQLQRPERRDREEDFREAREWLWEEVVGGGEALAGGGESDDDDDEASSEDEVNGVTQKNFQELSRILGTALETELVLDPFVQHFLILCICSKAIGIVFWAYALEEISEDNAISEWIKGFGEVDFFLFPYEFLFGGTPAGPTTTTTSTSPDAGAGEPQGEPQASLQESFFTWVSDWHKLGVVGLLVWSHVFQTLCTLEVYRLWCFRSRASGKKEGANVVENMANTLERRLVARLRE